MIRRTQQNPQRWNTVWQANAVAAQANRRCHAESTQSPPHPNAESNARHTLATCSWPHVRPHQTSSLCRNDCKIVWFVANGARLWRRQKCLRLVATTARRLHANQAKCLVEIAAMKPPHKNTVRRSRCLTKHAFRFACNLCGKPDGLACFRINRGVALMVQQQHLGLRPTLA